MRLGSGWGEAGVRAWSRQASGGSSQSEAKEFRFQPSYLPGWSRTGPQGRGPDLAESLSSLCGARDSTGKSRQRASSTNKDAKAGSIKTLGGPEMAFICGVGAIK